MWLGSRTQFRAIQLQAQAMCMSGLRSIEVKAWAQGHMVSTAMWLEASLHVGIAPVKPCPVLRQTVRLMSPGHAMKSLPQILLALVAVAPSGRYFDAV